MGRSTSSADSQLVPHRDHSALVPGCSAGSDGRQELAASARDVRTSDLRVQLERATARKTAAHGAVAARAELALLEYQLAAAGIALYQAKQEAARSDT